MLCGRLDFMHIYDERKLAFWCRISSLTNVVMGYKNVIITLVGQGSLHC